jgi:protein phosphatase
VITRVVGTEPEVDVDVFTEQAEPGDVYLLCSDGLTDMVGDEEIAAVAERSVHDLDALSAALVAAANNAGGEDNVTVILFEIVESGSAAGDGPAPASATVESGPTGGVLSASAGSAAPPPGEIRRSGAGAGGRLTALLIVFAVLAIALLLLAWGIIR